MTGHELERTIFEVYSSLVLHAVDHQSAAKAPFNMSPALQPQTKASVSDLDWNMAFLRQGMQDDREKSCSLTRSSLVACQVQVHHHAHIIHHVGQDQQECGWNMYPSQKRGAKSHNND